MGHRMSVQDTLWLHMDRPDNLMVIDCVFWTASPVTLEEARQVMQERLVDRFPTFRCRPVRSLLPGAPASWEPDPDFAIDRHVVVGRAPTADRAGLEQLLSEQRSVPLPDDRPMWVAHVVPQVEGGSAVVMRLHHAIADGIRLTQVALGLFDDDGEDVDGGRTGADAAPRTGEKPSGTRLAAGLRALADATLGRLPVAGALAGPVGELSGALADAALEQVGRTVRTAGAIAPLLSLPAEVPPSWRRPLGVGKTVVWGDPIPLDQVKAVGRRTGGTVNDVLTTWLAGALARHLIAQGDQPCPTTWLMPVNLKPFDENLPPNLGNHFTVVPLELPSGTEPLAERIAILQERTAALRDSHTATLMYAAQLVGSQTPEPLARFLADLVADRGVGVLTNVPGPRHPVSFAGARVAGMVAWAPCTARQPISVSIFSYDGQVFVGFACDDRVIPDAAALLQAFHDEVARSLP